MHNSINRTSFRTFRLGKRKQHQAVRPSLDNFLLISEIVNSPDRIFADGQNKIGRDVIVYIKEIDGIGYRLVEEIRTGRQTVIFDSMRKKIGAWES